MFSNRKLLKTGTYRTRDSVANFQFRVTIQKIHSLIDMPTLEGLSIALPNVLPEESGSIETQTIKWQEKVFSRYEIEYYTMKDNCKSERQKQYFQRLKAEPKEPSILFTYVDGDSYYPEDLDDVNQKHMPCVSNTSTQSMYLMADLGQDVLLFSLHWFEDDGVLLVYPDFNRFTVNPYYHEARGSNLQMYHYALEKTDTADRLTEIQAANNIIVATKSNLHLPFTRELGFSMPKKLHRDVFVLLELLYASEFKYDELHLRYRVKLPDGVKMANQCSSEEISSTHSSRKTNDRWHFGHCVELHLTLPETREPLLHVVDLYLEAISIDSCCRERYLGHSHLPLSLVPGGGEKTLNFIQLIKNDVFADRLEAFLVGNRRAVDLVSFYGKTGQNILNRYGNETSSSGKLLVRYHIIRQHQPKVLNEGFYKATLKSKNITLNQLIASYHAARERLEEFVELKY
ncbi:tectonic-like complex member MKS1 [Anopheles bellator]|uniref:tectonic-like complex member MKS1 n=1 Tax=Anopheles bellator TaxID=139047 RepID=UPI002646FE93|nr:tectonic-like complex member MKS1 [Anopheles bellator]